MKKVGKMLLTFIVAMLVGVVTWGIVVPCYDFCPKQYPEDGVKCQECCDNNCTNNLDKDKCYTNCPPA